MSVDKTYVCSLHVDLIRYSISRMAWCVRVSGLHAGPKQRQEKENTPHKCKRINFKYITQEFRLSHLESESHCLSIGNCFFCFLHIFDFAAFRSHYAVHHLINAFNYFCCCCSAGFFFLSLKNGMII